VATIADPTLRSVLRPRLKAGEVTASTVRVRLTPYATTPRDDAVRDDAVRDDIAPAAII
jgi:hypothetical protein